MGGKKIVGAGDAPQVAVAPPPLGAGERLASSSGSAAGGSKFGYAGILKKGLVGVGANGKSKSSPERIGDAGESVKANGNGSHDGSACVDHSIHDALNDLTLQSVEHAGNTHQEEVAAAGVEDAVTDTGDDRNGVDILENGRGDCSTEQWKMEYKPPDGGSSRQPMQQLVRDYELVRSAPERDFRPPSLILPDAANIETVDADFRAPHSLHLLSLVMSPHDTKQILLDPNAREFTPSPSPCPSPVLPPTVVSIVPSQYHMEPHLSFAPGVELGPVMYSAEFSGGPVMPLYANGGPLGYGPIPSSPTPQWEGQPIGMGEMPHHIPSGSGPPPIMGHPPHVMRPFVSASPMHPYLSSGCSPMGSPTGSMSAFAVPPPLTGREHVSRALLLSGVPTELSDYQLKQELDQWGLVRALGLERRQEGLVTVHYYDLRHSKEALRDVQQQHLLQQQRMQQKFQQLHKHQSAVHSHNDHDLDSKEEIYGGRDGDTCAPARGLIGGKAVWAQYTVPVGAAAGPDGHNQGTLVVFNLDADMPLDELRAAFEAHGAVKELRETPAKKQHKFVEFYDVRDAARALTALDGHEIGGKRVKIEFSRPGGQARRARAQAQAQVMAQQGGSLVPMVNNRLNGGLAGSIPGQPMFLGWGGDPSMGPAQSMSALPGPPPAYLWANYGHVAPGPPVAPLSALVQQQQWNVGHGQMQPLSYSQIQSPQNAGLALPGLVSVGADGSHHGRQYGRGARGGYNSGLSSPGGSAFHNGMSGFGRGNHNHSAPAHGRVVDEPTGRRRRGGGLGGSNGPVAKMDLSCLPSSSIDKQGVDSAVGSRESPRSGKTGLTPKSSPREHAQYTFNADPTELNSESPRTTLMIKNIPNKYSQSMLLALLDQHCLCCNNNIVDPNEPQSAYDFVYLPIDFKNRCNLGYAFVNFTSVQATLKLYKSFHAQQWEAFNSRKICQVTYARVQGRVALEEHFRNSRFACDTDEYLPLVFSPPRTGIICPPPIVAAGHLAGRALSCSPRAEQNCRSNSSRSGEQHEKNSEAS